MFCAEVQFSTLAEKFSTPSELGPATEPNSTVTLLYVIVRKIGGQKKVIWGTNVR